MDPHKQAAESAKYIPIQYCAVVLPDERLGVFASYGAARTYQGAFTDEEFCAFIRESFKKQEKLSARQRSHTIMIQEEAARRQRSLQEIDTTISLDVDFTL